MSAEPVGQPDVVCVARARSVAPTGCRCRQCRAMVKLRRGEGVKEADAGLSEQAWEVVDGLLARLWSAKAIGSASGIPEGTIAVALVELRTRGIRRRWGPGTARALIGHGRPTLGRIGAVGTARRLRALAYACWSYADVAGYVGVSQGALRDVITCSNARVTVEVADLVERAWPELCMRKGPTWRAATRARREGWAPEHAWRGLDIDDPAVRPVGYARADRPSPSREAVQRRRSDVERKRAARADEGGEVVRSGT